LQPFGSAHEKGGENPARQRPVQSGLT